MNDERLCASFAAPETTKEPVGSLIVQKNWDLTPIYVPSHVIASNEAIHRLLRFARNDRKKTRSVPSPVIARHEAIYGLPRFARNDRKKRDPLPPVIARHEAIHIKSFPRKDANGHRSWRSFQKRPENRLL